MVTLIGPDNKPYTFPDENKDAVLATGKFTEVPAAAAVAQTTAPVDDIVSPSEQEKPMVNLIEKQSGAEVRMPEDQADALVKSGSHTVTDIPLADASGNLYNFPNENIPQVLQTGKFHLSTLEERTNSKYERENNEANAARFEKSGATGLKEYIGGNADAAIAAVNRHNPVSEIGYSVLGDKDVVKHINQQADQLAETNPVSYYTGAGVGEIGSAIGLGGVASGLTKGFGITNTAAKLAAEGAVYSAAPVTKAIVDKDPALAAESLALGVGMNFGIHGVFSAAEAVPGLINKGIEAIGGKVAPAAESQEEAIRKASNYVYKSLGYSPAMIDELGTQGPDVLKSAGIVAGDTKDIMIDKMQDLEKSGPAIGKTIEKLDELNPIERQPIIEAHLQKAQEEINNIMPYEVKEYAAAKARVEALAKENEALDAPTKRVFEKYLQDVEEYQNQHIAPVKPQELLAHENATNEYERSVYDQAELQRMEQRGGVQGRVPEIPEVPVRPETADIASYDEAMKAHEERLKNPLPKPEQPQQILQWIKQSKEFENAITNLKELPPLPPSAVEGKMALEPLLKEIQATTRKGSFAETQKLKSYLRGEAKWNITRPSLVNEFRKSAYGIVAKNLMNAEDGALMKAGGDPTILQALKQDRALYTYHKLIGDATDRIAAKQVSSSMMEKIFGATRHERALPIIALSMLSHAVGLGPLPGVVAGIALPFAKKALTERTFGRALRTALGENIPSEADTVVHALHLQDMKINEGVKSTLKALGSSAAAHAVQSNHELHGNGMKSMVPNQISSNDALHTLRTAVAQNVNNPNQFASHLGDITAGLRQEGLDNVADEYTQHQMRLMKVLQTIMPADPSMATAHPFAAKVTIDELSPQAKDKYNRAMSIASDPTKLLEMVKSNNITAGDVAIAAAVNPATLAKMRNALVDEAMKSKPDLSYQQRLSLGILMGTNIDESTTQIPVLQSIYPPPQAPGAPNGGNALKKGGQSPKLSDKSAEHFNNSYMTASEKVLQKL